MFGKIKEVLEESKERFQESMKEANAKQALKKSEAYEKHLNKYLEPYQETLNDAAEHSKIKIATCGLNAPYEICGLVKVVVNVERKITDFSGTDAFVDACFLIGEAEARLECVNLGGNMILGCDFELQRSKIYSGSNHIGDEAVFLLKGTAVKIL